MIEVHKYIADDGTEFDNEDDCLDYERGLNVSKYNNQIIALESENLFTTQEIMFTFTSLTKMLMISIMTCAMKITVFNSIRYRKAVFSTSTLPAMNG